MADITPADPAPLAADSVREQDKIMLVLAYFGLFALIPLLTVKDSAYVKWHAKQGMVLACAWLAFMVVVCILSAVLSMVIGVLSILFSCLMAIGAIGFILLSIFCMFKSVGGQRWRIPVLADIAEKF